jgi:pimeloyl-ACP methyl ester carboxylesterase
MSSVFKSKQGEKLVRERYRAFLDRWPVPREEVRVATSQGETFVVASGDAGAPALVLLHGSAANCAMWMGEVRAFAERFRVYAVDVIGEPGLSAASRPSLASDAHAAWLDDVLSGLGIERASFVGVSLGGWLALDYAIRRPDRVEQVAVLCPGGVGRQKIRIIFEAMLLRSCGMWGKRKLMERVLGRPPATDPPPALKAFIDFVALIHENFRPRMVKLPIFSDEALRRLSIPVLAVVGGRDVMLDSSDTKRRLEKLAPQARVAYLPEVGHFIPNQTGRVLEFLDSWRTRSACSVDPHVDTVGS